MSARFLVTWPCQDACGTIETDERVEGAPVYRCPGCDSQWIELNERTEIPGEGVTLSTFEGSIDDTPGIVGVSPIEPS